MLEPEAGSAMGFGWAILVPGRTLLVYSGGNSWVSGDVGEAGDDEVDGPGAAAEVDGESTVVASVVKLSATVRLSRTLRRWECECGLP